MKTFIFYGPLAQLVERMAYNRFVVDSIPTRFILPIYSIKNI